MNKLVVREHVLALVVGLHFVNALEGPTAESGPDFWVSPDHFGNFGVNVLEAKVVAGHVNMVLAVVGMIATLKKLEKFRLALIFRRIAS